MTARRATRVRFSTPLMRIPGGTRVGVQRSCDGCRGLLGNVTEEEMEALMSGVLLPSVVAEHGCAEQDDATAGMR